MLLYIGERRGDEVGRPRQDRQDDNGHLEEHVLMGKMLERLTVQVAVNL
jgi:hypothetical protein